MLADCSQEHQSQCVSPGIYWDRIMGVKMIELNLGVGNSLPRVWGIHVFLGWRVLPDLRPFRNQVWPVDRQHLARTLSDPEPMNGQRARAQLCSSLAPGQNKQSWTTLLRWAAVPGSTSGWDGETAHADCELLREYIVHLLIPETNLCFLGMDDNGPSEIRASSIKRFII